MNQEDSRRESKEESLLERYEHFVVTTESGPVRNMSHNMRLMYFALGLCGEAGEAADKLKKLVRDFNGNIPSSEYLRDIAKELGDIQWYLTQICRELSNNQGSGQHITLTDTLMLNMKKLLDRKSRSRIQGEGDDR